MDETCARCGRVGWMGAHISKGGPNGYNRAYCHGTLDGTKDDGKPSCYERETVGLRDGDYGSTDALIARLRGILDADS